jgi:hypothetical protein
MQLQKDAIFIESITAERLSIIQVEYKHGSVCDRLNPDKYHVLICMYIV